MQNSKLGLIARLIEVFIFFESYSETMNREQKKALNCMQFKLFVNK